METFGNPIIPYGQDFRAQIRPDGALFQPSHKIHIDSRNRDIITSPNPADFIADLPTAYRGVHSIEILEATIPIRWKHQSGGSDVTVDHTTDGYIFIEIEGMSAYRVNRDPNHSRLVGNSYIRQVTGVGQTPQRDMVLTSERAFAKLDVRNVLNVPYTSNQSPALYDTTDMILWRRTENRHIKYFKPILERLSTLSIRLVDRFGAKLYYDNVNDVTFDGDWSMTLEVTAQN